jgi:N-acetyltransferase
MITPVTLHDSLVCLEPMTIEHVHDLRESASEDRTTYAYTTVPNGVEETKYYIDKALAAYSKGRELPFVVRYIEIGRVVGTTRFLDLEVFSWPPGVDRGSLTTDTDPPTVAEIGSTWYVPSVQRTGVNTECKLLMLTHVFNVWDTIN